MKNILKIFTIITGLLLFVPSVLAQKSFYFGPDATVNVNDSVVFRLNDYQGDIQWQKSFDLENWENIAAATRDTLLFVADTTSYFRAEVIAGDCDPFYSDTTKVFVFNLSTLPVSEITGNSAQSGGNIISDGGEPVTQRGIVWSTSEIPTLDNNEGFTTDGSGTGEYTSELTGLSSETTYYVRAYATNSVGTGYGQQESFTTESGSNSDWPTDTETEVVDVINPATGKTWMDRNLGASRTATSSTDAEAYGDLYQWGRAADGHQMRTSGTTSTQSSSDTPGHGDFITSDIVPYDWRNPGNDDLWQGTNGTNNPCPTDYRLPTYAELNEEYLSWSSDFAEGAFSSPLKLPLAGYRDFTFGIVSGEDLSGSYWSSTISDVYSYNMVFDSGFFFLGEDNRAYGSSVRCIKNSSDELILITLDVTLISTNTAMSGGRILSDGGYSINNRGVVWDTDENPTLENNSGSTTDGSGLGEWSSEINGLSPETTYYVRAYATNSQGTAYGNQQEFTTLMDIYLPTVTTTGITNISQTTATGGGNVIDDGGDAIADRGVVWSTSDNPTLESNTGFTIDGEGTGEYISEITGLSPETTFYVRAYATNGGGTGYGQQVSFTTDAGNGDTQIVDVVNPITGKTWMDRNLGASRAATSINDVESYGDLYQWGRADDGHQKRTSGTTSTLSNTDTPGHGDFILESSFPHDWRSPQNDNLWQGTDGINNPCPSGYRLPTEIELNEEQISWDNNNAFDSPLKMPMAGTRGGDDGTITEVGSFGLYWSSSVNGYESKLLIFMNGSSWMGDSKRATGYSVRCIKN